MDNKSRPEQINVPQKQQQGSSNQNRGGDITKVVTKVTDPKRSDYGKETTTYYKRNIYGASKPTETKITRKSQADIDYDERNKAIAEQRAKERREQRQEEAKTVTTTISTKAKGGTTEDNLKVLVSPIPTFKQETTSTTTEEGEWPATFGPRKITTTTETPTYKWKEYSDVTAPLSEKLGITTKGGGGKITEKGADKVSTIFKDKVTEVMTPSGGISTAFPERYQSTDAEAVLGPPLPPVPMPTTSEIKIYAKPEEVLKTEDKTQRTILEIPGFTYDVKQQQRDVVDLQNKLETELTNRQTDVELGARQAQQLADEINQEVEIVNEINQELTAEKNPLEMEGGTLRATKWNLDQTAQELEQAQIDLENARAKVNRYNERSVNKFNEELDRLQNRIDEYNESSEKYNTDLGGYIDNAAEFNAKYLKAQDIVSGLKTKEVMLEDINANIEGGVKAVTDLASAYNIELEKLQLRDPLYAREHALDVGIKEIENMEWTGLGSLGRKAAGATTYYTGKAIGGVASIVRAIPEFVLWSPAREAQRAGMQDIETKGKYTFGGAASSIIPGVQQAMGIYNWRDIENKNYKLLQNINMEALKGGIATATLGFSALSGAASGVALPAATEITAKAATIKAILATTAKIGGGALLVGATVGPQFYGIDKGGVYSKISRGEEQIAGIRAQQAELESQYKAGLVSQQNYESLKDYLGKQLGYTESTRTTFGTGLGGVAKTIGEIAPVIAGGLLVAKAFTPKSTIVDYTKPTAITQRGEAYRGSYSKGGEISGKEVWEYSPEKGEYVKVQARTESMLPYSEQGTQILYQEKPQGIWNLITGKRIDTKVWVKPSETVINAQDILRLRTFGGKDYITLQKAGETFSTTQILDKSGKLLRTVKEAPLVFGEGVGEVPNIVDLKTIRQIPQQVDQSTIYQRLTQTGKLKLDIPYDEQYRLVGSGKLLSKADKLSQALPSEVMDKGVLYKYYPERGEYVKVFDTGFGPAYEVPTKLSVGEGGELLRGVQTKNIWETYPGINEFSQPPYAGTYQYVEPRTLGTTMITKGDVKNLLRTGSQYELQYGFQPIQQPSIIDRIIGLQQQYLPLVAGKGITTKTWKQIQVPTEQPVLFEPTKKLVLELLPPKTVSVGTTVSKLEAPGMETINLYAPQLSATAPLTYTSALTPGLFAGTEVLALQQLTPQITMTPKVDTKTLALSTGQLEAMTMTPTLETETLTKTRQITSPLTMLDTLQETLPITATPGLIVLPPYVSPPTTKSPVLPPIAGWFGSLGSGQGGSGKARRGVREWIVTNPIANYGEEWINRQQAKAISVQTAVKGGQFRMAPQGMQVVNRIYPQQESFRMPQMQQQQFSIPQMQQQQFRFEQPQITPRQRAQYAVERGFGKINKLDSKKLNSLFKATASKSLKGLI